MRWYEMPLITVSLWVGCGDGCRINVVSIRLLWLNFYVMGYG